MSSIYMQTYVSASCATIRGDLQTAVNEAQKGDKSVCWTGRGFRALTADQASEQLEVRSISQQVLRKMGASLDIAVGGAVNVQPLGEREIGARSVEALGEKVRFFNERRQDPIEALKTSRGALNGTKNLEEKLAAADQVALLFESLQDDYPAMRAFCDGIDAQADGVSLLNQLVGEELVFDGHYEFAQRIITAINESAKNHDGEIEYRYMVYSDIDDTIKGSLNDRASKVQGYYPGVMELYSQLSGGAPITFLSARPAGLKSTWVKMLQKKMPEGMKFYSLFGGNKDIVKGAQHYTIGKLLSKIASILRKAGAERLAARVQKMADNIETETYMNFGLAKARHINFDLLLRPHQRGIFFGDDGEGDVLTMLMKNCTPWVQSVSALQDPRIPKQYLEKEVDLEQPGNPVRRPLAATFAHVVKTENTRPSPVRPQERFAATYAAGNVYMMENAAWYAGVLREKGMLTAQQADAVIAECEAWLEGEAEAQKQADQLSISDHYRADLREGIAIYKAHF